MTEEEQAAWREERNARSAARKQERQEMKARMEKVCAVAGWAGYRQQGTGAAGLVRWLHAGTAWHGMGVPRCLAADVPPPADILFSPLICALRQWRRARRSS